MPENSIFEQFHQMSKLGEQYSQSKKLMDQLTASSLSLAKVDDSSFASHSFEIIKDRIKEFEDQLDEDHEVAVKLASFGSSVTMSVTDIGYSNPSTLVFYGLVNGNESMLIQHLSQLNFLLIAVPKADPKAPARRIGFLSSEESETGE